MKSQSDAIWATCDREVRPLRATFAACSARCVQEAIGVRPAWALPLQPYAGLYRRGKARTGTCIAACLQHSVTPGGTVSSMLL